MLGHKLVMNPEEAIEAAHILGAGMLVLFHYAMNPRGQLVQTPYSLGHVMRLQETVPDIEIIALAPGVRRTLRPTRRRRTWPSCSARFAFRLAGWLNNHARRCDHTAVNKAPATSRTATFAASTREKPDPAR